MIVLPRPGILAVIFGGTARTHHVGPITSMSDCISVMNQTNKLDHANIPGGSGSYLPFPPYFQRMYTSLCALTTFGLRVIMAMLGCPLVLRRPLRDLAVVNIVSDNSSARQCG